MYHRIYGGSFRPNCLLSSSSGSTLEYVLERDFDSEVWEFRASDVDCRRRDTGIYYNVIKGGGRSDLPGRRKQQQQRKKDC